MIAVCALDHGDDSVFKLFNLRCSQDVSVSEQISADWTNRELVSSNRLYVDKNVACIVSCDDPRI